MLLFYNGGVKCGTNEITIPMKIKFTRHAKFRCMQRKIPEQWVESLLSQIPLLPGTHEQLLEGTNLTVVFHDGDINRTIITLYGKETSKEQLYWHSRKHMKQIHVKDMVIKENQKLTRRKNKTKKFKKR